MPVKSASEFKTAVTHHSYREKGKDNSRYVFIGMFESKGVVARLLFRYKAGTGMQLQHSLGNAFSQVVLERLFDKWSLNAYIRCSPELQVNKYKHIFVYGVLGFVVVHFEPQEVESFLLRHLVTDKLLLAHDPQRFNKRAVLDALGLQNYGKKSHVSSTIQDERTFCEVTVGDKVIATHESKSREYALKKAIEKAIKYILSEKEGEVLPYIQEKEALQREESRLKKAQDHEEFLRNNELKKQKRKEKSEIQKAEKIAKDRARQKAKAKVKKAKERRKEGQIVITADMNASKRRRLEDKLK